MNNAYEITIIRKGDKKKETEYQDFLDTCPDAYFQQTLQWKNVIANLGTDEPIIIAITSKNNIVGAIPLYIFRSKYGSIINSIPYPGPLGGVVINSNHPDRETIFSKLMASVDDFAKQNNCIVATIISAPFIPDHDWYRKYFQPTWELENYTLYLDLKQAPKTTSHFRNNLNRMLKKAASRKFSVLETTNLDDFERWYLIHSKRHNELGIHPLPKNLLMGFFKHLIPHNKGKFFVVKNQNGVVAGCFVAYHAKIIDTYIYSGDATAYKEGVMYLLIHHIIEWSRNQGFEILNWQSSKPRSAGPYNFKMQWGSKETPYYFFTKKYGDITPLVKLGLDRVKEEYKWHFVLPYSAFK